MSFSSFWFCCVPGRKGSAFGILTSLFPANTLCANEVYKKRYRNKSNCLITAFMALFLLRLQAINYSESTFGCQADQHVSLSPLHNDISPSSLINWTTSAFISLETVLLHMSFFLDNKTKLNENKRRNDFRSHMGFVKLLVLHYQDVPFQQKTWFDGDADACLAVTLDVTAKKKEKRHSRRDWSAHMILIAPTWCSYSAAPVMFGALAATWPAKWESGIKGRRALIGIMWEQRGKWCGAVSDSESKNLCAPTVSHLWPCGCAKKNNFDKQVKLPLVTLTCQC